MTESARPRLPPTQARKIVRTLATWLESPSTETIERSTRAWTVGDWSIAKRLVTIHGLAAHLSRSVDALERGNGVPAEVGPWIREQHRLNARRIDLLHDELAAILAAASVAGVATMPLKGALLTTMEGADPHRRPMGDLDLLVHPVDRAAMNILLRRLGYENHPEASPRPTHDVFLRPGNKTVVSVDEHPDNPRRVEVHTEVMRHLWGWVDADDLTNALWAGAVSGTVLGQPAVIPRLPDLFVHLAIHASSDMLVGRGRLIQWVDLSVLAGDSPNVSVSVHPRLVYPAWRLASRAMPIDFSGSALKQLEEQIPASLARWAASVQLDDGCGLMVDSVNERPSALAERWRRWGPARWRLAVAYGNAPLPVALIRHGRTASTVWRGRFSDHGPESRADR